MSLKILKPSALLISTFLQLFAFSQTKDVKSTFVDAEFQEVSNPTSATAKEERWQEGSVWKAKVLDLYSNAVLAEYSFADSTRKFKQGVATYYGGNHKRIGQETYVMGIKQGPFAAWQLDGTPRIKGHYKQDKMVDTIEMFNTDGKRKALFYLNDQGIGNGQEFFTKAGVTGEGKVLDGKQDGLWIYKDKAGRKVMEVTYNEKGIEKETCFGPNGEPNSGQECASDKPAEFPGGSAGWERYLQKNLKYPKSARKEETQGAVTVKFNVAADGTLSNIRVMNSPHPDLGAEAVRVFEKSPNWIPAKEANKIVPYTHIQTITFRLE